MIERVHFTFEIFAFGTAELLQVEVEHGSQPVYELGT